jgi:hypothetical protein
MWHVHLSLGNNHDILTKQQPLLRMAMETIAVARQWLSSNRVVPPKDMNATTALQHRNGVFYAVHAEML